MKVLLRKISNKIYSKEKISLSNCLKVNYSQKRALISKDFRNSRKILLEKRNESRLSKNLLVQGENKSEQGSFFKEHFYQASGILVTIGAFVFSVYQFKKTWQLELEKHDYEKQSRQEESYAKSIQKAAENLERFTPPQPNPSQNLPYFDLYTDFKSSIRELFLNNETTKVLLIDGASGSGKSYLISEIETEIKIDPDYKGAIIHINKMHESKESSFNSIENQIKSIYKLTDYSISEVLSQHKQQYSKPVILVIDNIQRIFFDDSSRNIDLKFLLNCISFMDQGLLKLIVVSSEYDVYYNLINLSNSWFGRVVSKRMPIFSSTTNSLKEYLLSEDAKKVFQYESETDWKSIADEFGNQLRLYLPLVKTERGDVTLKDKIDIVKNEYLSVVKTNLSSANLPKNLKSKEKKLKKILKQCIPIQGSIPNKIQSENERCPYEMKDISPQELRYLCKINLIKENITHQKINYYSSLTENIIKNNNLD